MVQEAPSLKKYVNMKCQRVNEDESFVPKNDNVSVDDVLSLKKCLGTEDIPGRLKCGLESYSGVLLSLDVLVGRVEHLEKEVVMSYRRGRSSTGSPPGITMYSIARRTSCQTKREQASFSAVTIDYTQYLHKIEMNVKTQKI